MSEFSQVTWHTIEQLAPWLFLGMLMAGLMHVWLPRDLVRTQFKGRLGVLKAVVLGIPLPLCSCGVIPAGIGLKRDGASNGASIGFLISTPQTGVDSVLVSASFLGWPFAMFKVLSALVMGLLGGWCTDVLSFESTPDFVGGRKEEAKKEPWFGEAVRHGLDILRSIWGWIVVGVLASAVLTVWAPEAAFTWARDEGTLVSSLVMLLIAVPMYVCSTASVPIAAALVAGGVPPGAALVFLMAGPATNLATVGAVRAEFGWKNTAVYLLTIVVGSVVFAIGFDQFFELSLPNVALHDHDEGWLGALFAAVLVALMAWFAVQSVVGRIRATRAMRSTSEVAAVVSVDGMTCQGCVRSLDAALRRLDGVNDVLVTLDPGRARVEGAVSIQKLHQAIEDAGFTVVL